MAMMTSFERARRALLRVAASGPAAWAAAAGPSEAQSAGRQAAVERLSIVSAQPFAAVVSAFEASIGRPDIGEFMKEMAAAPTYADVEKVVERSIGTSGFMEFARFNLGYVIGKQAGRRVNSLRFLIGNPLIMAEMAKHVPDAGSYAPVTVLIDERADGVHVSYDKMASFLAPYGNADALKVAHALDAKVENLLRSAAG